MLLSPIYIGIRREEKAQKQKQKTNQLTITNPELTDSENRLVVAESKWGLGRGRGELVKVHEEDQNVQTSASQNKQALGMEQVTMIKHVQLDLLW